MIPLYVVNCYSNGFQGNGIWASSCLLQAWQSLLEEVMAVVAADARSYTMACMASPFAWIVATVLLIVLLLLCDEGYEEKIMSAVKARITNP